jgi:quinol monooxygenase YgiN
MKYGMESEMVTIEAVVGNSDGWGMNVRPNASSMSQTLNVRAVEFIGKPGRIRDLRTCIRDRVMGHLKQSSGFLSAIVMTSHKEPRQVLVLSFWETESQATNSRWERAPEVRKMVLPLIDLCSKVQTYEAAIPETTVVPLQATERQAW